MKVVFWSNMHGQSGTSSNLIAIALALSVKMSKKVLIMQTHYNMNCMEECLTGKLEGHDFFRDTGLDALSRLLKSAPLTAEMLSSCTVSFLEGRLDMLMGTKQPCKEVFNNDICSLALKVFKEAGDYYDYVLMDAPHDDSAFTTGLFTETDVIVVNLRQNRVMIDAFMADNKLPADKTFFIFGMYDEASKYSAHHVSKRYKCITTNNCGVVPYDIAYSDALSDGKAVEYFEKYYATKHKTDSFFFDAVEVSAKRLVETEDRLWNK
jgi:hypothetical protein